MSVKSSTPEPGWYLASAKNRKYIVIVPTSIIQPTVAVYTDSGSFVSTFTYPNKGFTPTEDFPWHEYTLEKLNDISSSS